MARTEGELEEIDREALLRWRLALGPAAERTDVRLALGPLSGAASSLGVPSERVSELDDALSFVYGERSAGLAASRPYLPRWLAAIRELFSQEVVSVVQKDAIERRGLKELLLEPETLPFLERNVELVATLVSAKGLVPDEAREAARMIVSEVVEDLRRKLETSVRTSILGAVRRNKTSPLKIARNIDWHRTIRTNLRGFDPKRKQLVPERFHFFANQRRRHDWDVLLLVDQSASMAESVVYASVMAAIFASLDVLGTRLVLFDTEVVDVTAHLFDPVEILFSAQLGGGTDIHRAVAYAEENILERPERTILILISDLFEGGDRDALIARMRRIAESKVRVFVLLALSDSGAPAYDHELARALANLGIPSFACSPKRLVDVMAQAIKGDDPSALVTREEHR